uniref:Membrane-spanning 4-domains subfamily A member 4A-like n=1 Tax=Takifugu rubripes TaxID=31033 RepID=A0A3B5K7B9_TAKRU
LKSSVSTYLISPSLWQYIVAGSLTVAAGKYDSRCLVSMLFIVTTVISLTAAILHGLDTAGILSHCSNYSMCYQYMTLSQGFSGILAVFNLLMLAVSITVAGFACNATCSCCNPPVSDIWSGLFLCLVFQQVLTEMVIAEQPAVTWMCPSSRSSSQHKEHNNWIS